MLVSVWDVNIRFVCANVCMKDMKTFFRHGDMFFRQEDMKTCFFRHGDMKYMYFRHEDMKYMFFLDMKTCISKKMGGSHSLRTAHNI